ncbi:hypothetical protein AB6813_14365 [bacterium RCC_150]
MSIQERLTDADVLWNSGRREGALFNMLIAVAALARSEFPRLGDGDAFRTFLGDNHDWSISVEHRGEQISVDQLFWKWVRCEVAHVGALPLDVQFFAPENDTDDLRIQAGGAPEYCVRLSDGWYRWLRSLAVNTLTTR